MLDAIESRFISRGLTPKGQRALATIYRATREAVTEQGVSNVSLDLIAGKAGLTQAALRYHFPTREELLTAFFVAATEWFQDQVHALLATDDLPARERLAGCISWHLQYMEMVDTAVWLEASAFWLRRSQHRRVRDSFYHWVLVEYADLVGDMKPGLTGPERDCRAFAILTLVLGAWITHGRGSALELETTQAERRRLVVATAMEIAEA